MIEESRHGEAQAESGCEFVDVNTLKKSTAGCSCRAWHPSKAVHGVVKTNRVCGFSDKPHKNESDRRCSHLASDGCRRPDVDCGFDGFAT